MGKGKTPSFVVTRRIYTTRKDEIFIDRKMDICNRMYNTAAKYCMGQLEKMRQDVWYRKASGKYAGLGKAMESCTDKKELVELEIERNGWAEEMKICRESYGLTEYGIHTFMGRNKQDAYGKGINIDIVQNTGSELWKAVEKAVFRGTKVHFRKYGQTDSFESKKANSAIIYRNDGTVKVMGKVMRLRHVREKDYYLQEAMMHKVKYCRIVRKPFMNGYRYFLQMVMEGEAPRKLVLGKGICGVDEGTSTVAYCNNTECKFLALAENSRKYRKLVRKYATEYDRRRRMGNPECYKDDGTIIKGAKFKNGKNARKSLMKLKAAYRLKAEHTEQSNSYKVNRIVEGCDTVAKEPMNFKALAKRAKETSRRDRASAVKQKDGTVKQVHKFRRKKRFGTSVLEHSPGQFNRRLEQQVTRYGGRFMDVDKWKYKASQYDHVTGGTVKAELLDRCKVVGGHRVQRDLYSAFLLMCYLDMENIDFGKCRKLFKQFLHMQGKAVNYVIRNGDKSPAYRNFGLELFAS